MVSDLYRNIVNSINCIWVADLLEVFVRTGSTTSEQPLNGGVSMVVLLLCKIISEGKQKSGNLRFMEICCTENWYNFFFIDFF